MTPLPYLAPSPNPPFFRPGTIATHSDLSSNSTGMPLSGVCMISLNTSVARLSLLTSSLRSAASALDARNRSRKETIKDFITHLDLVGEKLTRSTRQSSRFMIAESHDRCHSLTSHFRSEVLIAIQT